MGGAHLRVVAVARVLGLVPQALEVVVAIEDVEFGEMAESARRPKLPGALETVL